MLINTDFESCLRTIRLQYKDYKVCIVDIIDIIDDLY